MEEDIKILENMLNKESNIYKTNKRGNKEIKFEVNSNYYKALENLINGYRELEKERDGIYEDYQELGKEKWKADESIIFLIERLEERINNSIPKSKIKEKIEEYKQEMKEIRAKEKGLIWNHRLHKLDYAIQVLQELMEDK